VISGESRALLLRRAPGLLFASSVVFAVGLLLRFAHRLWFFGDDWDFLLERGVAGKPELGLFAPHNEHWSTVPILVFRGLFSVFGVRHYLPYAASAIALHAGITVAMWVLLRRSGIRPWIAAAFGAVLAVGGAGAENTLWDFQIGFLLPVLCSVLCLCVMPTRRELVPRDAWVAGVLLVGLMSSGQGIVAVVVVASYALFTRSARVAGALAGIGAVTYLTWFLAAGREGLGDDSITLQSLGEMPEYLWTGLSHVWSAETGIPGIGLIVLVLAVSSLVHQARHRPPWLALASAGLLGALTMFALAGTTRAQLGLEQSLSSRYVYIAAVLTTPLLAAGVQRLVDTSDRQPAVVPMLGAALTGLVLVSSVNALSAFTQSREAMLSGIPERIVGAWQLVHDGAVLLRETPDSQFTPNVTAVRLRSLQAAQLPQVGSNSQGVLDAAAWLQVDTKRSPFAFAPMVRFTGAGISHSGGDLTNNCLRGTASQPNAYIDFRVPVGGGTLSLATSDRHFGTQLVKGGSLSTVVDWKVGSGERTYVATTARDATLRIILPSPTRFTLCAGTDD
jgi:hypothetical protein